MSLAKSLVSCFFFDSRCITGMAVADLEGAEPAPPSSPWATDRCRHGTPDKWQRYCITATPSQGSRGGLGDEVSRSWRFFWPLEPCCMAMHAAWLKWPDGTLGHPAVVHSSKLKWFAQWYLRYRIPRISMPNLQLQQHDVQNRNAKRPIPVLVWGGCDVVGGGVKPPQAQA